MSSPADQFAWATPRPAPERCVVVLVYSDHSGIQACWGPFPDRDEAQAAIDEMKDLPLFGLWEIHKLRRVITGE